MPSLSPTMTKGGLLRWHVKEGTAVESGDTIAEIETDKATLDFDTMDEGIVAKILVPAGTKDIEVGTPIAILVEEEKHIASFESYKGQELRTIEAEPAIEQTSVIAREAVGEIKVGPAARKLAQEKGLMLRDLQATGPKGIITKEDVLNAMASPPPTSTAKPSAPPVSETQPVEKAKAAKEKPKIAVPTDYSDLPLTQMRRVIAQRLLESKTTIPGIYFSIDCDLTEIQQLRETLKSSGSKISVNDFVTRAVALSLRDVPAANAYWDGKEQCSKPWTSVDISIAVSTPAGLITPIIKAADTKSIKTIAEEIRDLATKARNNKLKPEEFIGGTFTISNLGREIRRSVEEMECVIGMFGIDSFSAIINPPQSCIMAVGGSHSEIGYVHGTQRLEMIPKMTVTLTADHRVFDGDLAHQFLAAFQQYIERPLPLLV